MIPDIQRHINDIDAAINAIKIAGTKSIKKRAQQNRDLERFNLLKEHYEKRLQQLSVGFNY